MGGANGADLDAVRSRSSANAENSLAHRIAFILGLRMLSCHSQGNIGVLVSYEPLHSSL